MPTKNELHTFGRFKKEILSAQADYQLPEREADGSFKAPMMFTSGHLIGGEELKAAEWMAMLEFRALQLAIKCYKGPGMTRPDPTLTSSERDVWFVKERNCILFQDNRRALLKRYRERTPASEQLLLGMKTGVLVDLWRTIDSNEEKVKRVVRGGYGVVVEDDPYEKTYNKGYGPEVKDALDVQRKINPQTFAFGRTTYCP